MIIMIAFGDTNHTHHTDHLNTHNNNFHDTNISLEDAFKVDPTGDEAMGESSVAGLAAVLAADGVPDADEASDDVAGEASSAASDEAGKAGEASRGAGGEHY